MANADVDRWAEREQMVEAMSADELRAYAIGIAHAYVDVFDIFSAAFEAGDDLSVARAQVSAQYDVRAIQVGVL